MQNALPASWKGVRRTRKPSQRYVRTFPFELLKFVKEAVCAERDMSLNLLRNSPSVNPRARGSVKSAGLAQRERRHLG